jgi:hypothetical protein
MELNAENQPQAEDVARPENSEVEPVEQDTQSTTQEEPQKVPLKELVKQRKKTQAERTRVEQLEQKLDALEKEKQLYQIVGDSQPQAEEAELLPPNPNDFIDDDEWIEANRKYNQENTKRLRAEAEKAAQEAFKKQQEGQQQAKLLQEQQAALESSYEAYYDEADKLGVDDFLEKEEIVRKQWSPWFFDKVISTVPNPHQVIVELSKEPQKAFDLAAGFDKDPFKGGLELLNYANSINPINQKGDPLPEPDEPLKGGAGGVSLGSYEAALEKSRADMAAGKITMNQHLANKSEFKAKYGAT